MQTTQGRDREVAPTGIIAERCWTMNVHVANNPCGLVTSILSRFRTSKTGSSRISVKNVFITLSYEAINDNAHDRENHVLRKP